MRQQTGVLLIGILVLLSLILGFSTAAFGWPNIEGDPFEELWLSNQPGIQELARSTFALVKKDYLTKSKKAYYLNDKVQTYQQWGELCSGVEFANQPSLSDCSGFLIDKDKIATAAHCMSTKKMCQNWRVVFDFQVTQNGTSPLAFDHSQVYRLDCTMIAISDEQDVAMVKTKRPVANRSPLKIRFKGALKLGTEIHSIGHPHGLPAKVARAVVDDNVQAEQGFFEAKLSTLGGSSGSAVINLKTKVVEGLVSVGFGQWDKRLDPVTGAPCYVPAVRSAEEATATWISRSKYLVPLFSQFSLEME